MILHIGIYMITNIVTNMIYIGQSNNIDSRWRSHLSYLKNNTHYNSYLQRSFNIYGRDNFVLSILEECNTDLLDDRERYWIDYYKATDKKYGYNHLEGGQVTRIVHDETRQRMSESGKLKIFSDEHKRHITDSMNGRKYSEESKKKMSQSKLSVGHLPPSQKGKIRSEETKLKMGHIKPTDEMTLDVRNNMTIKEFVTKYNYGRKIWRRCKYAI